jgi:hypothetical protein
MHCGGAEGEIILVPGSIAFLKDNLSLVMARSGSAQVKPIVILAEKVSVPIGIEDEGRSELLSRTSADKDEK